MSSERYALPYDGGALGRDSVNKMGAAAAHADDYVLQELLRLTPWRSDFPTYAKVILPMRHQGGANQPFLAVGPGATPLVIAPFRAVVGPRVPSNGTPPTTPADPIITTAPELSYRDIRSAVFAAAQGSASSTPEALGYEMPSTAFAPGDPTNPRWDAVYAALFIDQPADSTQIMVKPPTGGTAGPVSGTPTWLTSMGSPAQATTGASPAIGVVTGTPGATPALPAIPADVVAVAPASQATFYLLLGYVLIPAGWTQGSVFLSKNIQTAAVIGAIDEALGVTSSAPIDAATTWSTVARPPTALPRTMVGGTKRRFLLDATLAAGASAAVTTGYVLDATIDWRARLFDVTCQVGAAGTSFVTDPAATTPPFVPEAAVASIAYPVFTVITQPLCVMPSSAGGGTPFVKAVGPSGGGGFLAEVGGGNLYYVELPDLVNGAELVQAIFACTSSSSDGSSSVTLVTLAVPGVSGMVPIETPLGAAANAPTGTFIVGSPVAASGGNDRIDTTTYRYYAKVAGPSGGSAVAWTSPKVTILQRLPGEFRRQGQSFREDSAYVTSGIELGASGAGFAFYASPEQMPMIAANSALGLYADLATGHLCLFYQGTPGVKCSFVIEASGAFDNL